MSGYPGRHVKGDGERGHGGPADARRVGDRAPDVDGTAGSGGLRGRRGGVGPGREAPRRLTVVPAAAAAAAASAARRAWVAAGPGAGPGGAGAVQPDAGELDGPDRQLLRPALDQRADRGVQPRAAGDPLACLRHDDLRPLPPAGAARVRVNHAPTQESAALAESRNLLSATGSA